MVQNFKLLTYSPSHITQKTVIISEGGKSLVESEIQPKQIISDKSAIDIWLGSYSNSSFNTLRSAKKESERFLMWLEFKSGFSQKLLPKTTVKDVNEFLDYLKSPIQLPQSILARYGKIKQPILGSLSRSSIRQSIVILHRMFEALRNLPDENNKPFITFNPWALASKSIKHESAIDLDEMERFLTPDEWQAVQVTIENFPQETKREKLHYARSRWITQLIYRTWLRREAVAQLRMSDFIQVKGGWVLRVVGKGQKTTKIIATSRLMNELFRYRKANNLTEVPHISEDLPAVLPIISEGSISSQAVYLICKTIFEATANRIQETNPESAITLRKASPHWLRHTGITAAMEAGISPRYVQAQAQHSSLKITNLYDHKYKDVWRDQFEKF